MATRKSTKRSKGRDEEGNFGDFLEMRLEDLPEDKPCPPGRFRVRCKGYKIDKAKRSVMLVQQPVEVVDAPSDTIAQIEKMNGADLAPVFENFSLQAGKPGGTMLKRRWLDSGIDATLSLEGMCKAMVGVEGVADIVHAPNPDTPTRPYINLKNWAKA